MTNKKIIFLSIASLAAIMVIGVTASAAAIIENPPVAVVGGPYFGELGVPVNFDGSGSFDPEGDPIDYAWDFGDGNFGIGPTPSNTYLGIGSFDVCLTVTDPSGLADTSCTTAEIVDTTPPIINCPVDVAVNSDEDTSPSNTGEASATDSPNPDPITEPFDEVTENPNGTTTIEREWTATDPSGNTASCTQIITVVPLPVDIDIKPNGEPNSINVNSKGVLPVAIFGSPDFDVTQIDVATVDFDIFEINGSTLATKCNIEDVDGDGIDDMVCFFKIQEIDHKCEGVFPVGQIKLDLLDGTSYRGLDEVRWVNCEHF